MIEMEHLTVHRIALMSGLIGPRNGRVPCIIDCLWVLADDADLPSMILYECGELSQ